MEGTSMICSSCRRSIRQLASKAGPAAKARNHWARSLATTPNTITPRNLQIARVLAPVSRWQGSCYTPKSYIHPLSRQRQFSSTTQRPAAVLNPRQDEDGNEMVVEMTERAASRLKQIMTKDANPELALRITVESGGCHGFQYLMSLTDMSKVSQEEDTVFEAGEGARIVLDEPSLELLKGSKVDYTMELIGSQFKIVDNPHATSSCGCGTSFDIKG